MNPEQAWLRKDNSPRIQNRLSRSDLEEATVLYRIVLVGEK